MAKSKLKPLAIDTLLAIANDRCFKYVNRGTLWYNKLTEEQKEKLAENYDGWCNLIKEARQHKPFYMVDLPDKLDFLIEPEDKIFIDEGK